jgi:rubrerythrin
MSKITEYIGHAAVLEQCAEECTELAMACLKLARIIRKENPTSVTVETALSNLEEEIADVKVCLQEMDSELLYNSANVNNIIAKKRCRWEDRIECDKAQRFLGKRYRDGIWIEKGPCDIDDHNPALDVNNPFPFPKK